MGDKPSISRKKYNLEIAIWKSDGQRAPSCNISRDYKPKGSDKYVEELIRCYCSDLILFRDMLNEVIDEMTKEGGYPLEFKSNKK